MAAIATKEQLATPFRRKYADVPLPNRGVTVRIQTLSEREHRLYRVACSDENGKAAASKFAEARALLPALCLVDENNQRMFSDTDASVFEEWHPDDTVAIEDAYFLLKGQPVGDIAKN